MSPTSPLCSVVAENERGKIVGIANYSTHDVTSALSESCYLHDLFVDSLDRAGGVGKSLIDWLIGEMKSRAWSSIYWHTKENNYYARGLYDKFTPHSGFLRYVIMNS